MRLPKNLHKISEWVGYLILKFYIIQKQMDFCELDLPQPVNVLIDSKANRSFISKRFRF